MTAAQPDGPVEREGPGEPAGRPGGAAPSPPEPSRYPGRGRGDAPPGRAGAAGSGPDGDEAWTSDLWAPPGWVYVVGGGDGDPGLLTVRGARLLQAAEVVVADAGLEAVVAAWGSPTAALWLVAPAGGGAGSSGELPAGPSFPRVAVAGRLAPEQVPGRLARWVRAGLRALRLVRGAIAPAEVAALAAAGCGVIPVPGVATGPGPHLAPRPGAVAADQGGAADRGGEAGQTAGAGRAAAAGPPLQGWRIAVTRAPDQAGDLEELLRQMGAHVVELPLIAVEPADGEAELDGELDGTPGRWWVFTSRNGVAALARRLEVLGRDARSLAGSRLAVVGEATRRYLGQATGLRPDLMPARFTGAHLWEELARHVTPGQRVIWPRGDRAAVDAAAPVVRAGAELRAPVVYRTILRREEAAALLERIAARQLDAVTLASPSAAEALAEAAGPGGPGRFFQEGGPGSGRRPLVICIGPRTAQRAAALGLPVDGVPARHTAEGLVMTLLERSMADRRA